MTATIQNWLSLNTSAWKTLNCAPLFQLPGGNPAFRQRLSSISVRLQPCSVATCGRKTAERPFFLYDDAVAADHDVGGPGDRLHRGHHRNLDFEAGQLPQRDRREAGIVHARLDGHPCGGQAEREISRKLADAAAQFAVLLESDESALGKLQPGRQVAGASGMVSVERKRCRLCRANFSSSSFVRSLQRGRRRRLCRASSMP